MIAEAIRLGAHRIETRLGSCAGCKQRRGLIRRHVDLRWHQLKNLCRPSPSVGGYLVQALVALGLGVVVGWLAMILFLVGRIGG